jgi:hypothetical protein
MYIKPEIAVLGEASRLILGSKKSLPPDGIDPTHFESPADSELDD